jgi:uncharacterized BrkB/YihY/UPF0761 family membrane protein
MNGGFLKLTPFKLIFFSGLIWFAIGLYLLTLGMHFIVGTAVSKAYDPSSLLYLFSKVAGSREQAALLLIILGLLIGFIKGRMVLAKTVQKVVQRILALPRPIKLSQVYGVRYLALIALMVLLGMSLKWLQVPPVLRGVIDVAIGSALMNGASAYFRMAFASRQKSSD